MRQVKIFTLLAVCVTMLLQVLPVRAAECPVKVRQHWVTTHDNYTLDCSIYAPKYGAKMPVVILSPSWGISKIEYMFPALKMAADGYIVVSYSARGWFKSTGRINVGEENDMRDISTIIDFVLVNYPADVNNIGLAGISMGANRALEAGIFDNRIKTVAVLSGAASLRDVLYWQDTPNMSWSSKNNGGDKNMIADLTRDLEQRRNVENILQWMDDISAFRLIDEYARTKGRLSVYISHAYHDPLFIPNSVINFFSRIDIPGKVIDLEDGMHVFPVGYGCMLLPSTIWDKVYKWFDYHLKGIDSGISGRLNKTPVSFGLRGEKTRLYFAKWPTERVKYQNYYLNLNGLKSLRTGRGSLESSRRSTFIKREIKSGKGSIASFGPDDLVSQFFDRGSWTNIYILDRDYALTHLSAATASGSIIAGIPTLDISVTPSHKDAQVIAHLYDVDELGNAELVSYSAWTLFDRKPGERKRLSFEFHAVAWRLKKNHRLAVVFDAYDKRCGFPERPDYRVRFHYDDDPVLKVPFVQ